MSEQLPSPPHLLRSQGLRATPQRAVILDVLAKVEGHRHLTAREVFEEAADQLPGLNLATVYRTLEGMHGAGLVDQMVSSHDQVRFSLRHPQHRHGHLVCRRCNRTLTVDIGTVQELADLLHERFGFRIDEDHLTMPGVCRDCLR